MAVFGVEFTLGIPASIDNIEDKVDALYSSLTSNFALCSIDVAWNEEKGSVSVLLGVQSIDGLDADSFVEGVASDAFKKALADSGLRITDEADEVWPSSRILEFAA